MKPAIQPVKKLMVANRGEIAIRVLRAAYELGLRTVAVYTYEDRYSLHRYKADEAYQIGRSDEPLKPYLDIDELIHTAKINGVDAIHPGYGFLSENVEFAKRCAEAGILFVGPSPEAMAKIGDKMSAKITAQALGVPLIQGNEAPLDSLEVALSEAGRIGYPVMLKATSGGGGRGMRVARNADELAAQFQNARNEAKNAFGDDTVFLEKFVESPKHIEVQIFGDKYGNLVHLYERDCSVQRRFQKVIEIAPAPTLSQATKDKLYEYALRLGKSVNYSCAGTVEFLVDPDENIYFIEVNPRIQVEHTVTEVVTGIDIVRNQILVAQGYPLSDKHILLDKQKNIKCNGFAIQCRLTTEDPENNFRPDYGRLVHYRSAGGFGIRLDEGNGYPGARISPFFDSMLVKVTASGRTLKGACRRMGRALAEFRIRGVKTNIPFLINVINNKTFLEGEATVKFIEENPKLVQFEPWQDRGTRALSYLADVIVNGNPDVKSFDPKRKFRTPVVPNFEKYGAYPDGTKQKLTELGPEKFAQWVKNQPNILYTDTTFRDAHQSLLATRVRTVDMLTVAEAFAKNHPNLFSMEVWGGATFDVALRFLHECPWERLRLLRKAIPNTLLQMLIRGSNAVGYAAYPDNLIEKFIEKSWETGVDVFRIFDSLNLLDNMKISIDAVRERTGGLAEVCICYTGDILDPKRTKYTLQYYLDLAKRIEDSGAHILAIKDMAGLLKPYAAEKLISELKKSIDLPIHLHTHDTAGVQTATYLKAVEAGVDVMDVALSSLSGLTSQPNFNSVVEMLRGTPRECAVDMPSLNAFSDYWENVREYYYPFESDLKFSTSEVYQHEIPGGQYSNLRPQAESLGLGDRWVEVKRNFELTNELFGDIVKVTPSSKVTGDFALFLTTQNLTKETLFEKGANISFPDSVIGFFRGELGVPEGGFPAELQKIVLKDLKPFVGRANDHLPPADFDAEFAAFQQKFGSEFKFTDYLSYKMFPKVFEEYAAFYGEYGNISHIPTPQFFYGLTAGEETIIGLEAGKSILVRFLNVSEPNDAGLRTVYFELNGQTRNIEVDDRKLGATKSRHKKAASPDEIAAPLQGRLSKVLVEVGQKVEKNAPLFILEAMKMETTVTAPHAGTVQEIFLKAGAMVETGDAVARVEKGDTK